MFIPKKKPYLFVVVEGIDGSGKSSQIPVIAAKLEEMLGKPVLQLREPGSTPAGEKLREFMLANDLPPTMHMQLMFAARKEMIEHRLFPAFHNWQSVLCDRYIPSTMAYQCEGQGANADLVDSNVQMLTQALPGTTVEDITPDLTLYFDLRPEQAAERMRASADRGQDTFERRDVEFFARVRHAYLEMAHGGLYSKSWAIIDASRPQAEVSAETARVVEDFMRDVCFEKAGTPSA